MINRCWLIEPIALHSFWSGEFSADVNFDFRVLDQQGLSPAVGLVRNDGELWSSDDFSVFECSNAFFVRPPDCFGNPDPVILQQRWLQSCAKAPDICSLEIHDGCNAKSCTCASWKASLDQFPREYLEAEVEGIEV